MGLNYSMTGIFYNKALAAKIGMTKPPETVAEFDDLMAKAKAGEHRADHRVEQAGGRSHLPAAESDGLVRRSRPGQ